MHDATLVYFFRENDHGREVCLGLKKKSLKKFGVKKWNGFGGSVESDEGIVDCACREVTEEAAVKIKPQDLRLVARITFHFPDVDPSEDWDQTVYVFFAEDFLGDPAETAEMIPEWFPVQKEKLPWAEMWVSDDLWVWDAFSGAKFAGTISFNERGESVRSVNLEKVAELML